MDDYFLLKIFHILGATILFGTGIGTAFFMLMAYRSKNVEAIIITVRNVIIADWLFTAPAVILQLITGILLMEKLQYSYTSSWFATVIGLFVLVGFCWLPVVYIQYLLKHEAELSVENRILTTTFCRYMKIWIALGIPTFIAVLLIFWLMIFKPLSVI